MPRNFDHIEESLLLGLQESVHVAARADSWVGYFNVCGWKHLVGYVIRQTAETRRQRVARLASELVAPYARAASPLEALRFAAASELQQ
ncbi:MAG TPA: hypothetical protein VF169_00500 [Albitalea sp.]|uniref:hypothetical protein n=1 Tax=Piscinibacter sp. TaxID=1903157 RepID=UPI002ED04BA3